MDQRKISQLARLAQLKSDIELRRFAAFQANMTAAHRRISDGEEAIARAYSSEAPLSLAEGKLASLQAGEAVREMMRARQDLTQMQPKFDLARGRAAKEFGRARVLSDLTLGKVKG